MQNFEPPWAPLGSLRITPTSCWSIIVHSWPYSTALAYLSAYNCILLPKCFLCKSHIAILSYFMLIDKMPILWYNYNMKPRRSFWISSDQFPIPYIPGFGTARRLYRTRARRSHLSRNPVRNLRVAFLSRLLCYLAESSLSHGGH